MPKGWEGRGIQAEGSFSPGPVKELSVLERGKDDLAGLFQGGVYRGGENCGGRRADSWWART